MTGATFRGQSEHVHTSSTRPVLVSTLLLALAGCGSSSGDDTDASTRDAGPSPTDGGSVDAARDAGGDDEHDAGAPDAGPWEVPAYTLRVFTSPTGMPLATPYGMNDEGTIVGNAGPEPWSPDSIPVVVGVDDTAIDPLETERGLLAYARDADDGGRVVGEHDRQPHLWEADGRRVLLQVPSGFFSGAARAIGEDGTIAGSYADHDDPPPPVGPRPVAWASASATGVELLLLDREYPVGQAVAIAGGRIIGSLTSSDGMFAVVWDTLESEPTPLPRPDDALGTEAFGANERGDVVGRALFEGNRVEAYAYWSASDEPVVLGAPEGATASGYAEAHDVDERGVVVGTARVAPGVVHAMLWAGDEAIDLDAHVTTRPAGVRAIVNAAAIDTSGRIAVEVLLDGVQADLPRAIGVLTPVE
ncbi:Hypothetical protein I5071_86950 [Sandaracinus amylolyticus]|nr:Hypothetical protein I5071_86950 [Sandaracinus amylolyticus]